MTRNHSHGTEPVLLCITVDSSTCYQLRTEDSRLEVGEAWLLPTKSSPKQPVVSVRSSRFGVLRFFSECFQSLRLAKTWTDPLFNIRNPPTNIPYCTKVYPSFGSLIPIQKKTCFVKPNCDPYSLLSMEQIIWSLWKFCPFMSLRTSEKLHALLMTTPHFLSASRSETPPTTCPWRFPGIRCPQSSSNLPS